MIVHPLCQQTHSLPSESVSSGIRQSPIHSSGQCEAEVVADVDCELVISLQPDDEPGPLFGSDRNCPVCLHNVAYGGLGSWREAHDEQRDYEKVPQVHGKSSQLMCELIDVASGEGTCG